MQKFSDEGHIPSPDPNPLGAYGASIFASTALKLNVTPPSPRKKILVTALYYTSHYINYNCKKLPVPVKDR